MKLITELNKPYTENQRIDFIIEQNHRNGYEIRETETSIQAWGLDDEELLEQKKAQVRSIRISYLVQYVDPKQLVLVWDSLTDDDKTSYSNYRTYLLDYTKGENWWEYQPKSYEKWKEESTLNNSDDVLSEVPENKGQSNESEVI